MNPSRIKHQPGVRRILAWGLMAFASQAAAAESGEMSVMRNAHFASYYQAVCRHDYQVIGVDSSADAAAQNEIRLTSAHFYQFQLGDSGEGFMQLHVPEWATKLIIGHDADVGVTLIKGIKLMDNLSNSHCKNGPAQVSHFEVHEWGSYTLAFTGPAHALAKLAIIKETK